MNKNVPFCLLSRLPGERRFFDDGEREENDSGHAGSGQAVSGDKVLSNVGIVLIHGSYLSMIVSITFFDMISLNLAECG